MIATSNIQAQGSKSGFDPDKLIFGGDIGFGISSDYWTVGASPQVGYKLTNRFHVGAGIGYRFGKSDQDVYIPNADDDGNISWNSVTSKYTENSASINLFAHYYPWKKLIFSIKPEIMHTWYSEKIMNQKYKANKFVPAITVGGGIHLRPVILQINYELLQNDYSPYNDGLFFSVGLMF